MLKTSCIISTINPTAVGLKITLTNELGFALIFHFQVMDEYEKCSFDFLAKAFNDPKYLEDLTGLTKLHADTADVDVSLSHMYL